MAALNKDFRTNKTQKWLILDADRFSEAISFSHLSILLPVHHSNGPFYKMS